MGLLDGGELALGVYRAGVDGLDFACRLCPGMLAVDGGDVSVLCCCGSRDFEVATYSFFSPCFFTDCTLDARPPYLFNKSYTVSYLGVFF